jgi:uncharacterized protein YkuJ
MTKKIIIRSYFSIPTDLAAEMRDWVEFVDGENYSVNLETNAGEIVSVRYVEENEDCFVTVISENADELFDRVVGRTIYALSKHSDNLMVSNIY